MPIILDPAKSGFEKVLRDYQTVALKMVWANADVGVTSRQVFNHVNMNLDGEKTISRASIINFLNGMCDEDILNYEEETCKGGVRRKYTPSFDEDGFAKHIARSVFDSLYRDFPDQTIEAVRESLGSKADGIPGLK